MKFYTRILMWENSRRIRVLSEFRTLVVTYFRNTTYSWMANGSTEKPVAKTARANINRDLHEVRAIVMRSGLHPQMQYLPGAAGGYAHDFDLFMEIFNLHNYSVGEDEVLDFIDRSLGVYIRNKTPSFWRSINPLFYVAEAFKWAAELPFVAIGRAGFNREKAESSLAGRVIKLVVYIIAFLASLLTVIQLWDQFDRLRHLFDR